MRMRTLYLCGIVGVALLACAPTLVAQSTGRTNTGNSTGAGNTGNNNFGSQFGNSGFNNTNSGFGNSNSGGFSGSSGNFSGSSGSNTFGSSGGTFGGNTAGGNFSGGNFSGNSMGGTFRGGSTGSIYVAPTQSNAFRQFYSNPYSSGLSGNTRAASFGSPLYGTTTTGLTGSTGTFTGTTTGGMSNQQVFNANSNGILRNLPYSTEIGSDLGPGALAPAPRVGPLQVAPRFQGVIAASSVLPSKENIQVLTDGNLVVLRGNVGDAHEALMAEGLLRLEPGVYEIKNELQVRETAPAPKKIQ